MQRKSRESTRPDGLKPQPARSALLGVRMSQERIIEVKVEAARRRISVADLSEDIWAAYVAKGINR